MRDTPSNVPAGESLRPIVGAVALVAVLALAVAVGWFWMGLGGPTAVTVTASADDSLVDAADVHPASELADGSPIKAAVTRAHEYDRSATVRGTSDEIKVVDGLEEQVVWVRLEDTQYRVRVVPVGG